MKTIKPNRTIGLCKYCDKDIHEDEEYDFIDKRMYHKKCINTMREESLSKEIFDARIAS